MDNFSLKIEGFESNEPLPLSKVVFDSFIESDFIEKSENEILLKNDFFSEDYKVPNVCRYILKKTNGEWELNENKEKHKDCQSLKFKDQPINFRQNLPSIILILESPHILEYTKTGFSPIAPAQGATGLKIKMLESIIRLNVKRLNINKKQYKVLIVNPVPFQTSLWQVHEKSLNTITDKKKKYLDIRNFVWESLWNHPNLNLKTELTEIINNSKTELIINACTKEVGPKISDFLNKTEFYNITKFSTSHPYNWNIPKLI